MPSYFLRRDEVDDGVLVLGAQRRVVDHLRRQLRLIAVGAGDGRDEQRALAADGRVRQHRRGAFAEDGVERRRRRERVPHRVHRIEVRRVRGEREVARVLLDRDVAAGEHPAAEARACLPSAAAVSFRRRWAAAAAAAGGGGGGAHFRRRERRVRRIDGVLARVLGAHAVVIRRPRRQTGHRDRVRRRRRRRVHAPCAVARRRPVLHLPVGGHVGHPGHAGAVPAAVGCAITARDEGVGRSPVAVVGGIDADARAVDRRARVDERRRRRQRIDCGVDRARVDGAAVLRVGDDAARPPRRAACRR